MGGWLRNLGALDFAGGIVVHVSSGVSALVMAIFLGKRIGYENQAFRPHNLPWTVLGAGMLWFGWFGFNAGSALAANSLAANAFVVTNTAAGTPTLLGTVTGVVAGLVAITPACGFVTPLNAIFIGALVSIFCFLAITKIKARFRYDDSLDVFGVHGVGGIWGTIATGLFAEKAVNAAGADGLLFGGVHQFLVQILLVIAAATYAVLMTWALFKLVDSLIGMRVDKKDELIGLDLTQHNESAYTVLE